MKYFRPRDLVFPFKCTACQASPPMVPDGPTPSTSDNIEEDLVCDAPPQKRQRTTADVSGPTPPTQGTIRSNPSFYGIHAYSLGFFFGL